MTETAHTPGPWAITSISQDTGNIGVGHKDQRILIADVTNASSFGDMLVGAMRRGGGGLRQDDCHTQFANARLIAAAPDLLDALKAVRDWDDNANPAGYGGLRQAVRDVVHAAISKAEGRSR